MGIATEAFEKTVRSTPHIGVHTERPLRLGNRSLSSMLWHTTPGFACWLDQTARDRAGSLIAGPGVGTAGRLIVAT